MKILKTLLLVAFVTVFLSGHAYSQKITAEEIISKHLDSIGTASDRAQVRNVLIKGDVKLAVHREHPYKSDGKVILASEGSKALFRAAVNPEPLRKVVGSSSDKENIVFDGTSVQVGFPESDVIAGPGLRPVKSDFEFFIEQCNSIVKNGILGGSLFTGWNLANRAANRGILEYNGMESADGEKYYVLRYDPKDGSNVKVKIFFDTVTFQHKRTEYYLTLRGALGAGGIGASSGQGVSPESLSNYMKFTEVFSDFRKEGQLTLPHKYTMDVMAPMVFQSESDYILDLKEFLFNVPFDPASFNVVKKVSSR